MPRPQKRIRLGKDLFRGDALETDIVPIARGISVIICCQTGGTGEGEIKVDGLISQRSVQDRGFWAIQNNGWHGGEGRKVPGAAIIRNQKGCEMKKKDQFPHGTRVSGEIQTGGAS